MPISIVVGGQFGSEGKGKVAHYLAVKQDAAIVVRCGGTNSGHTVIDNEGNAHVFRQLPTSAILPDTDLALCAGSYIDLNILFNEIKKADVDNKRLMIDPFAVIITDKHKDSECSSDLIDKIGSTGSGTGAAVMSRIMRKDIVFAKDVPELSVFIKNVSMELRNRLKRKHRIILEGTQGFGLSSLHSENYPFVTSRDTTASGFLSEAGLSPFDVDEIAVVIRSFPIRVAGNSGPLPNEIDWSTVSSKSGNKAIVEYTSVTRNIRRVAEFDSKVVNAAINSNNPSMIFLNHLDYIGSQSDINVSRFVHEIERSIDTDVTHLGFGPASIISRDMM